MAWHVADTYAKGTIIGEAFDNGKGKKYIKVKCKCERCGGLGIIVSRVENGRYIPIPVDGGVCYECGGDGYVIKKVRAYDDREYANYLKAKERTAASRTKAAQAKKEQREQNSADNLAKALVKCGIREDGVAFICKGETFSIKDDLKEHGFRFHPILMWYAATADYCPDGYELAEVQVKDYIDWFPQSLRFEFKAEAQKEIRKLLTPPSIFSSETVGSIKERLRDMQVKFLGGRGFEGQYGYTHIYRFVDTDNHLFTWFTTKELDYQENEEVLLTGTVKNFNDYNGEISTVVTRCIIKSVS